MPKYKLALIFGEYNGEIKEFDSIQEREAFRDGVYTGSNAYGRGCVVYTLEEAQNELNDLTNDPKSHSKFPSKIKQLEEVISALSK